MSTGDAEIGNRYFSRKGSFHRVNLSQTDYITSLEYIYCIVFSILGCSIIAFGLISGKMAMVLVPASRCKACKSKEPALDVSIAFSVQLAYFWSKETAKYLVRVKPRKKAQNARPGSEADEAELVRLHIKTETFFPVFQRHSDGHHEEEDDSSEHTTE